MKYLKSTFSWLLIWTVIWVIFWFIFSEAIFPGSHNPIKGVTDPFIMPMVILFSDGYGGTFIDIYALSLGYWGVFASIIFYKKIIVPKKLKQPVI